MKKIDHSIKSTTVGKVRNDVLAYTVGNDIELDKELLDYDCIGSAAHIRMLASLKLPVPVLTKKDADRLINQLVAIMREARKNDFLITIEDQDVHMAVERVLTEKLGEIGKRIHTARSRNDQIALDLRLYAKDNLLAIFSEIISLLKIINLTAKSEYHTPMVGRTHLQPAMPSSVALWLTSYAESLLDDVVILQAAYKINNASPLGAAAGYGVPFPINREMVANLLGFNGVVHNVIHCINARGKLESIILQGLSQVMLTLSRLAQDLIIFSMPEFGYMTLPSEMCTGSSIMPQKKNPDVLELIRAKASSLLANTMAAAEIVKALPCGYNRDLQEIKGFFISGIKTTYSSLQVMRSLLENIKFNSDKLRAGFTPEVFATDKALELVREGMPFRDAYNYVKTNLKELACKNPYNALKEKKHTGAPAGLDLKFFKEQAQELGKFVAAEKRIFYKAITKLLQIKYPF